MNRLGKRLSVVSGAKRSPGARSEPKGSGVSWIAVAALAAAVALMYESCPSTGSAPAPATDRRVLALLGEEGLPDCAAPEPGAALAPYLDAVLRRQTDSAPLEPCRPRDARRQDTSKRVLPFGAAEDVSALPPSLDLLLAVARVEL